MDLALGQDGGRQGLPAGGAEPVGLAVSVSPQPVPERQDQPIRLSWGESDLRVLLVDVAAALHGLGEEDLLLALKNDHVAVVDLVGGPVLVPPGNKLQQGGAME